MQVLEKRESFVLLLDPHYRQQLRYFKISQSFMKFIFLIHRKTDDRLFFTFIGAGKVRLHLKTFACQMSTYMRTANSS